MKPLKKILSVLGPGFVTGASDDDPSGIGTYSQTGAQFGYSQLWLAVFTLPFMCVIQEMCGRIGMVSGKGLARVIKKNYPLPLLYIIVFVLAIANCINIGANLGAMAASAEMLGGFPQFDWLVIFTITSIVLQIFIPYKLYSNYLKYLAITLFAYIITAFLLKLDWTTILKNTVQPTIRFDQEYLMNIVAILGTTISPYLFFWQSSEEVECLVENNQLKEMSVGTPDVHKEDVKNIRFDTFVGMLFSQIIMFFIIVTAAATLNKAGIQHVDTAVQAAQVLKPIAGKYASILFASGIIGTGFLSVPILAGSASYAIAETFGWKLGLYKRFNEAKAFYTVITLMTLAGFFINFIGIPPFKLLYYTAILNGLCAPVVMIMIVLIGNNKAIMGQYVNSKISSWSAWVITAIMTISAIALLFTFK